MTAPPGASGSSRPIRPEAAGALARFWDDRYARCRVVVDRATARGELPGPADARALLVAATAPLYHELLLLRAGPDPALPSRYASAAAAAGRAGAYRTGPPASTRCHG